MSDDIEWCAPPNTSPQRARRMLRFIEALKKRPGEWAIYEVAPGAAYGTSHTLRLMGCEVTVRSRVVYARWALEGKR